MPKFGDGLDPTEMAERSAEARSPHKDKDGIERLRAQGNVLFRDLVNAAKGRGRFKELPIEKQFAALKLALEYAYGRPRPMKDEGDTEPDVTTQEDDDSFSFETSHQTEQRPTDGLRSD